MIFLELNILGIEMTRRCYSYEYSYYRCNAIQNSMKTGVTLFFSYFQDFIKDPQTRNARAFLPLNISVVGSLWCSL